MVHRGLIVLAALAMSTAVAGCDDTSEPHAELTREADVGVEVMGCLVDDHCDVAEICVADAGAPRGTCVSSCSLEDDDVCPAGERCAPVIDADGVRASACVAGAPTSYDAWQRCDDGDACGTSESCVYLDGVLGARCVPSCNPDGSCSRAGDACALHWRGEHGDESGCARACALDADCDQGWRCETGASVPGLCVR